MTSEITEILDLAPLYLVPVALVFFRVGAVIFVLPAFGEMLVPMRVRLAGAIAFTMVTVPAVLPDILSASLPAHPFILLALSEAVTGLAFGFSLRFTLMALQVAATISAQSTSLSQLLGGSSVDPQPAIGFVLLLAALALAAELGLHVQITMMFVHSYSMIGLGVPITGEYLAGWSVQAVASTFSFAFTLAAPFVVVSLLYNLALGVINRAMPQLMVAFVGAPAITLGSLILLALCAPLILTVWAEVFQLRIQSPLSTR